MEGVENPEQTSISQLLQCGVVKGCDCAVAQRDNYETPAVDKGARIIRIVQLHAVLVLEGDRIDAVRSLSKYACVVHLPPPNSSVSTYPKTPNTQPGQAAVWLAHIIAWSAQRILLGRNGPFRQLGAFATVTWTNRLSVHGNHSVQGGASCRIHHRSGQHARPVDGRSGVDRTRASCPHDAPAWSRL
jgi:hypothetical protein